MSTEQWWNDTDRGKAEVLGEKPIPVTLYLPQTPHWLAWNRNRTSEARGRRPTASAMSRPWSLLQMMTITHSSCKLWRSWQLQNLRLEQVLTHVKKKSAYTRAHACMRTSLKTYLYITNKNNFW